MAILTENSILETQPDGTQTLVSANTGTWADFSSWDAWRSWASAPATLNHLTPIVDFGTSQTYTISAEATITGTATYYVYTSDTGAFAGEQTETTIAPGATDTPAFTSRYAMIGISVAESQSGIPSISAFNFVASTEAIRVELNDIVSSGLTGTVSSRTLSLPATVSAVLNMNLTTQSAEGYVDTDYVVTDYFEAGEAAIPLIVDKSRTGPAVRFINTSGTSIDTTFDAALVVLPQQYRNNDNLKVRYG